MISHILVLWLLSLFCTLIIPISADCISSISCLCGSTNDSYTLCIDEVQDTEKPCDVWSHCKSCQDNVRQCIACPENRTGPFCLKVKQLRKRTKYVKSNSERPRKISQKSNANDCGRQGNKPITGEWPWTVAIETNFGVSPMIICAGALLNRNTVITAAHCVSHSSSYALLFGKYYRKDRLDDVKVEKRKVTQIIIHKDFNNVTFENDIALVRFQPPVAYSERIQPVCLPTSKSSAANLTPGNKGYVTGWGFNENNYFSDRLKVSHMPVQSDDKCKNEFKVAGMKLNILPGMFCAGFSEEALGVCRGDAGSPFVFMDENTRRYTLEGLASFGVSDKRCGSAENYAMFIEVAHYLPWILKMMS